jgi:hypothetical protein
MHVTTILRTNNLVHTHLSNILNKIQIFLFLKKNHFLCILDGGNMKGKFQYHTSPIEANVVRFPSSQ